MCHQGIILTLHDTPYESFIVTLILYNWTRLNCFTVLTKIFKLRCSEVGEVAFLNPFSSWCLWQCLPMSMSKISQKSLYKSVYCNYKNIEGQMADDTPLMDGNVQQLGTKIIYLKSK